MRGHTHAEAKVVDPTVKQQQLGTELRKWNAAGAGMEGGKCYN